MVLLAVVRYILAIHNYYCDNTNAANVRYNHDHIVIV